MQKCTNMKVNFISSV